MHPQTKTTAQRTHSTKQSTKPGERQIKACQLWVVSQCNYRTTKPPFHQTITRSPKGHNCHRFPIISVVLVLVGPVIGAIIRRRRPRHRFRHAAVLSWPASSLSHDHRHLNHRRHIVVTSHHHHHSAKFWGRLHAAQPKPNTLFCIRTCAGAIA